MSNKEKNKKKQTPNESLDNLFKSSDALRNGTEFKKFLDFIAKFKEYKPFNNMLIYTQNPNCEYYATEKDWLKKFQRKIKENARPMVILAPMHPVLFVYDINDTVGDALPEILLKKSNEVFGYYKESWFNNLTSYFADLKISAKEIKMPDKNAGSISRKSTGNGFEIIINSTHDSAVKFATLVHELGHLFLGHLGSKPDETLPQRDNLEKKIREIEAEAISYLVLQRFGLESNSHEHLAFYNASPEDLLKISVDLIIKISGRIEGMIEKRNSTKG